MLPKISGIRNMYKCTNVPHVISEKKDVSQKLPLIDISAGFWRTSMLLCLAINNIKTFYEKKRKFSLGFFSGVITLKNTTKKRGTFVHLYMFR